MFKTILATTALALTLPLAAYAEGDHNGYSDGYRSEARSDYRNSNRNVEYTTVSKPRQQCWTEQVPVGHYDNSGAIVGGIAGGIIGNQIGKGNGKVVATAVGALTGTIVGENLSRHGSSGYQTVQRCRTVYEQVQVPVTRSSPYGQVSYTAPVAVYDDGYYRHHRHHRHNKHCRNDRY